MPEKQMASSHTMKRFFRAFHIFRAGAFRWVLQELFHWRLQQKKPRMVVLTLDTMVMDNDEALQREGCDPTYKKVKGFQPLQLIWEGKIVDAIFRRGKRHSNYGQGVPDGPGQTASRPRTATTGPREIDPQRSAWVASLSAAER